MPTGKRRHWGRKACPHHSARDALGSIQASQSIQELCLILRLNIYRAVDKRIPPETTFVLHRISSGYCSFASACLGQQVAWEPLTPTSRTISLRSGCLGGKGVMHVDLTTTTSFQSKSFDAWPIISTRAMPSSSTITVKGWLFTALLYAKLYPPNWQVSGSSDRAKCTSWERIACNKTYS